MRSNSPARQDQAHEPPGGLTSVRNSSTARTTPPANRPSGAPSSIRLNPACCPADSNRDPCIPRYTSPEVLSRNIFLD
jgi:hypothetical protein